MVLFSVQATVNQPTFVPSWILPQNSLEKHFLIYVGHLCYVLEFNSSPLSVYPKLYEAALFCHMIFPKVENILTSCIFILLHSHGSIDGTNPTEQMTLEGATTGKMHVNIVKNVE